MRGGHRGIDGSTFPFDSFTFKIHALVFIRYRYASLAIALAVYASVMFATGPALGVSSNYFIIGVVIVAALCFGTIGGLVAGLLALPANLLAFSILGHPEYSPASKVIAELAGVITGFAFGRLADYFRDVEREITRRIATEEALRAALAEKELLLRELNHRVKNNLNVVKSLVQLQRNRSTDPAFLAAADELIGRIFAISLVHDQLNEDRDIEAVDPSRYLAALVHDLAAGLGFEESRIGLSIGAEGRLLPVESAISLGLIVNEVLTNALKHAAPGEAGRPSVHLSFGFEEGRYRLEILDDGPGPGSGTEEGGGGLGLLLVGALARNLGGTSRLEAIPGPLGPAGARFELLFPAPGA